MMSLPFEIEAALALQRPVAVQGEVVLTDTVDIGRVSGLGMIGAGCSFGPPTRMAPLACPLFIWRGPINKPIFRLGGIGNYFSGFHIHIETPCAGVFQLHDSTGIADGKHHFHMISVSGEKYDFIVAGEIKEDNHCDSILVSKCILHNARSFFRLNNKQSMGHAIENCHAINCNYILDAPQGGHVTIRNLIIVGPTTILNLDEQGTNNQYFDCNVKIDSSSKDRWKIARITNRTSATIYMSGAVGAQARQPLADLVDGTSANFRLDTSRLVGIK